VFCIRPDPEAVAPDGPYDCVNSPDFAKLEENESGLVLLYYLIDMRMDDGLGNVVEDRSNIIVQRNVTQKLTAVNHPDGLSYWVIVHGWKSNTFFAHRFSDVGMLEVTTSDVGSSHGDFGGLFFRDEVEGEMKLSPDGKKIAVAVFSENRPFEVFDFDTSTGRVENGISLGNISGQYAVSFSPDNS